MSGELPLCTHVKGMTRGEGRLYTSLAHAHQGIIIVIYGLQRKLNDEMDIAQVTAAMCRKANYLLHPLVGVI